MHLIRGVLTSGDTPNTGMVACGICIPKQGKASYVPANSYRVISLLSALEKVAANKIAEAA